MELVRAAREVAAMQQLFRRCGVAAGNLRIVVLSKSLAVTTTHCPGKWVHVCHREQRWGRDTHVRESIEKGVGWWNTANDGQRWKVWEASEAYRHRAATVEYIKASGLAPAGGETVEEMVGAVSDEARFGRGG